MICGQWLSLQTGHLSCSAGKRMITSLSACCPPSLRQAQPTRGRDMRRIALGLVAAALLAISAGTAMTAPASAAPIIIRDSFTIPIFEPGLTDDCRPGLTGTLVGTAVISFQSVETAQGFHIHITINGPGRIDWSDGSYTLIDSVDHTSIHDVGQGTSVFAETHTDGADFYSAAAAFEFRRTFHEVEHFTASNGVVRVDLNKGHFHSFGDCCPEHAANSAPTPLWCAS